MGITADILNAQRMKGNRNEYQTFPDIDAESKTSFLEKPSAQVKAEITKLRKS